MLCISQLSDHLHNYFRGKEIDKNKLLGCINKHKKSISPGRIDRTIRNPLVWFHPIFRSFLPHSWPLLQLFQSPRTDYILKSLHIKPTFMFLWIPSTALNSIFWNNKKQVNTIFIAIIMQISCNFHDCATSNVYRGNFQVPSRS